MTPAIRKSLVTLESEHRSIRAVLDAMGHFAQLGLAGNEVPEARVFRAMLMYVDAFAEGVHHPKEERVLFPLLRKRSGEAAALLDQLRLEHLRGARAVRELEQSFLRWEEGGSSYFADFGRHISDFVAFYRDHLRVEERQLIPLAERALTEQDWEAVDASFEEGVDPLRGPDGESDLRRLFTHIVTITPAPFGVGDPLPKR
jgi:hemerythrin-like domain-containing protein